MFYLWFVYVNRVNNGFIVYDLYVKENLVLYVEFFYCVFFQVFMDNKRILVIYEVGYILLVYLYF